MFPRPAVPGCAAHPRRDDGTRTRPLQLTCRRFLSFPPLPSPSSLFLAQSSMPWRRSRSGPKYLARFLVFEHADLTRHCPSIPLLACPSSPYQPSARLYDRRHPNPLRCRSRRREARLVQAPRVLLDREDHGDRFAHRLRHVRAHRRRSDDHRPCSGDVSEPCVHI